MRGSERKRSIADMCYRSQIVSQKRAGSRWQ